LFSEFFLILLLRQLVSGFRTVFGSLPSNRDRKLYFFGEKYAKGGIGIFQFFLTAENSCRSAFPLTQGEGETGDRRDFLLLRGCGSSHNKWTKSAPRNAAAAAKTKDPVHRYTPFESSWPVLLSN